MRGRARRTPPGACASATLRVQPFLPHISPTSGTWRAPARWVAGQREGPTTGAWPAAPRRPWCCPSLTRARSSISYTVQCGSRAGDRAGPVGGHQTDRPVSQHPGHLRARPCHRTSSPGTGLGRSWRAPCPGRSPGGGCPFARAHLMRLAPATCLYQTCISRRGVPPHASSCAVFLCSLQGYFQQAGTACHNTDGDHLDSCMT